MTRNCAESCSVRSPLPWFALVVAHLLCAPACALTLPCHGLCVLLVHNLSLAALSSVLLVGIVHQLVQHWRLHARHSVAWASWVLFCDPSPHQVRSGLLMFFYYLNYLTKIVELSDTVLLCLRGKPLHFLHVYHHAATLVLTWTQLVAKSGVQWVPIVLNLTVHVPMYYYYAVATLGQSPWWKKYLTTAQIVQFCIDVPATGVATLLKVRTLGETGVRLTAED